MPGFNAATANSPWRTESKDASGHEHKELQCGHGEFAVENATTSVPHARDPALQCGHGEFAVENSDICLVTQVGATLQCGHGEFAVENEAEDARVDADAWRLQCGHGEFAVENPSRVTTRAV